MLRLRMPGAAVSPLCEYAFRTYTGTTCFTFWKCKTAEVIFLGSEATLHSRLAVTLKRLALN